MIAVVVIGREGDVRVGIDPYNCHIATILFGKIGKDGNTYRTFTSEGHNPVRGRNPECRKGRSGLVHENIMIEDTIFLEAL